MSHPAAAVPNTFVLERNYPKNIDCVWSLLSDVNAKRLWFFEDDGTQIGSFTMDFTVGGREHAAYTIAKGSPVDGQPFVNEGIFFDIVPRERIVMAQAMSIGGRKVTVSLVTYELAPEGEGTKMTLTHQAIFFEGSGGPELRKHGWEVLLDKLSRAVTASAK